MESKNKKKKNKPKPLFEFDKEINTIISCIEPRINEVCVKFANGLENEATMFAFWVGMGGDLNQALKRIEQNKKRQKLRR